MPSRPSAGLHWRGRSATIRGHSHRHSRQRALQGANMKLAFFDNYKLGVVVGDKIVDVSGRGEGHQGARPAGRHPRRDREVERLQGQVRRRRQEGQGQAAVEGQAAPAAAEAREHHLHGGELHGGRHAAGARPDQRLHEVAELDHRRRRHHGAARHGGVGVRGRGGARRRDRQEGLARQGQGRDEIRVRLHQLHRRLGARRGAADQRVLPDEVARHLRADRALYRHRRRDQGPRTSCRSG